MKTTRHIFWRRWLSDGAASTRRKRSRTRRLSIEYLEARLALDAKSFLWSGGVSGDGTGLVTVTGVAPATSSTATVTITNENSVAGSALFTGTSLTTDYTVTNSNGEITITGYRGAGGAVTIPSTIGGLPVRLTGGKGRLGRYSVTPKAAIDFGPRRAGTRRPRDLSRSVAWAGGLMNVFRLGYLVTFASPLPQGVPSLPH